MRRWAANKDMKIRPAGFIILTTIIAAAYVVATIYLMNVSLVKDALFGAHALSYRWEILVALLGGMWTAMSRTSLTLLIAVALLTGINLTLVMRQMQLLRRMGSVRFVAGGGSLLGVVGSGCASCGLPVLALLGLGGAAAYLPFGGAELSAIAIVALSISLFVLIRNRSEKLTCPIPLPHE